jgi:hypothetical protein
MNDAPLPFPEEEILTARLGDLLGAPLVVTERQPNRYASIFLSEIVTCRRADGAALRLLCKSGIGRKPGGPSHPGRVAYEAMVYRDILQPSRATVPRYYGTFSDAPATWLVLEYLDAAVNAKATPNSAEAFHAASRWIAHFHARHQGEFSKGASLSLQRHDANHYRDSARRAARLAHMLGADFQWLPVACQRFVEEIVDLLTAQPQTIIHGDYFSDNVLHRDGAVFPIDWEWAAAGVGEVDIACLTENWPADLAAAWVDEYRQARWPKGAPTDFHRVLEAVRLYLCFKYLGKAPDLLADRKRRWRLAMIRSLSEKSGLL